MFTGLVEEIGTIKRIDTNRGARRLTIAAVNIIEDLKIDDSVAVNGVCLTVTALDHGSFFMVEAVQETLEKSTISHLKPNSSVNLERALKADGRLGGHFVQGHVDGVGKVMGWQEQQGGRKIQIRIPSDLLKYLIPKGSISINGCSLTLAQLGRASVQIALIPHTLEMTNLGMLKIGDEVNIEVDILGKYIHKYLEPFRVQTSFPGLDIRLED